MTTKTKAKKPTTTKKLHRGFRAMKPETQKDIAKMGGKAVARRRGKKWMATIGRKGGKNSHRKPRTLARS